FQTMATTGHGSGVSSFASGGRVPGTSATHDALAPSGASPGGATAVAIAPSIVIRQPSDRIAYSASSPLAQRSPLWSSALSSFSGLSPEYVRLMPPLTRMHSTY